MNAAISSRIASSDTPSCVAPFFAWITSIPAERQRSPVISVVESLPRTHLNGPDSGAALGRQSRTRPDGGARKELPQNGPTSRRGGHSSGHNNGLSEPRFGFCLCLRVARLAKLLEETLLAVRQGFEPWIQVLARITV